MTKVQKIWLGIFLAMFIVPEVLWGPLLGIIAKYSSITFFPIINDSQLINDNSVVMNLILLSEIVGLGGLCILNFRLAKKKIVYLAISETVLSLILIVLAFVAYFYSSLDRFLS